MGILISKTKRCVICGRCGAYAFNDLCSFHWSQRVEENIIKFVEDDKKKRGY